jgi:hypothetical protein
MNRYEYDQQYDPLPRGQSPPRARPRRKRIKPLASGEAMMFGWSNPGCTDGRDREWTRAVIRAAVLLGTPLLVLLLYFSFLAGATLKPRTPATPKPKRASKIIWVKLGGDSATPVPAQGDGKAGQETKEEK